MLLQILYRKYIYHCEIHLMTIFVFPLPAVHVNDVTLTSIYYDGEWMSHDKGVVNFYSCKYTPKYARAVNFYAHFSRNITRI